MSAHSLLLETTSHLIHAVLPAADDYDAAEDKLSTALQRELEIIPCRGHPKPSEHDWNLALDRCAREAQLARRRAAEFAIAAEGLTDRAAIEIVSGASAAAQRKVIAELRHEISCRCFWPGTRYLRQGALDRIRAVANASGITT